MYRSIPTLHALTTDVILADATFVATATTLMQSLGSRVAIHLRATEISAHRLLELALELRVIAETTRSWVLMTDRVDIAMVSGITGAQLTSRSIAVADARRIAPSMVIGASVHSSAEAWMMAQSGATYLVAGAAREAAQVPAVDEHTLLQQIVDSAEGCPVVAVGGITPETVHRAASAGASGIAAMRGIWLDDALASARRYLAAYDEGLRR